MSYAITPHGAETLARVSAHRIEKEKAATLNKFARALSRIENNDTLLRRRDDGRIKTMPSSLLAKIFSGARYEREAERAKNYFGLTQLVTVRSAGAAVQRLTAPVLHVSGVGLDRKTPEQLLDLGEKLSSLDDGMLLHFDGETIRPFCDGMPTEQIGFAQTYFQLDAQPTVKAVRQRIEDIMPSAMATAEMKALEDKVRALPGGELKSLQQVNSSVPDSTPVGFDDPNSLVEIQTTAIDVRRAIANEMLRRDFSTRRSDPDAERIAFRSTNQVFSYPSGAKVAAKTISLKEEGRRALGDLMDDREIKTFFDVAELMYAEGANIGKVVVQLALELCEGTHTESSAREYVNKELGKLPPAERADFTELVVGVHRRYLEITSTTW